MAAKSSEKKMTRKELDEALLDNFVNLQKVLTNLTVKFDNLSNNVSKLLELFEISAKSFAKKSPTKQMEIDKEFLDKLDSLLDQNKVISKGIMLMEERVRSRGGRPEELKRETFRPRPMPMAR